MKVTKSWLGFSVVLLGAALIHKACAITFQDAVDVQFSFEVSMDLTLSSSVLAINELMPGNYANSNTITANVKTNSAHGYTLSAMVSGIEGAEDNSLYNAAADTRFSSIADDANMTLADFSDNYWGYTTVSTINDSVAYSGLPYGTGRILNKTKNNIGDAEVGYIGTNSTSFTIGARASSDQAAGIYSNVINFAAVGNPAPLYMQDVESIAAALPNSGNSAVAVDSRDGQEYTIARLADGKIWMTKNLNLAGGTAMSYNDTDFPYGYTPSAGGLTVSGGKVILPASATITSGTSLNSAQFSDNSTAYVFNSNRTACSSSSPCYSYYSYMAATAGSGTTTYANAPYSICPKNWRLPTATASDANPRTNNNWKTGDFYALATAYGTHLAGSYVASPDTAFYSNAGPRGIPKFLLSGGYDAGLFKATGGAYGYYWSATGGTDAKAFAFSFSPGESDDGYVLASGQFTNSAYDAYAKFGYAVRCLLDFDE